MATRFNVNNLEFKNPIFHEGLNTTVRIGDKWMNRVCIGDRVWLVDVTTPGPDAIVGCGEIKGKMVVPFMYIPQDLLMFEHDSKSKTIAGLFRTMKVIYKDRFNENSICTVLLFELV